MFNISSHEAFTFCLFISFSLPHLLLQYYTVLCSVYLIMTVIYKNELQVDYNKSELYKVLHYYMNYEKIIKQ